MYHPSFRRLARYVGVALVAMALVAVVGCTQEQQNKIGREIQKETYFQRVTPLFG